MSQSPVTRVELQKLSGGRVLQHLAIGGLFGIGLFVAVSGIYGLSEDTNGSEWVLVFGLLLILLAELLRRANLNQIRPGAIVVADSKLRITYPPLLRGPLELDLDDVSVAAIAAENAEPSFPVYADGQRTAKVTDELPAVLAGFQSARWSRTTRPRTPSCCSRNRWRLQAEADRVARPASLRATGWDRGQRRGSWPRPPHVRGCRDSLPDQRAGFEAPGEDQRRGSSD